MLSAYQTGPEESFRWINSKHFHISLYSSKVSLLQIMLTFQFSRWSGYFLSLGQIEMWWLRQDDWPLSKKHKVHLFIGLPLRATPNHEMRSSILSMSKKDKMANGSSRRHCLCCPIPTSMRGGDGSCQVVWWTDLEVDLERTQNYCVDYWPYIYARQTVHKLTLV